jgi:heme/copper-type cytochrome/quinol oxidase subunit 3
VLVGDLTNSRLVLAITILLGVYFLGVQGYEYIDRGFTIADRAFGSVFFVATGFHGLHVFVGLVMLRVALGRMVKGLISSGHHFGFESSAWY